jgi:spermidine synthase
MRWGIYACFFLSGATAIVFEVLWSRQFVTVFGNSSYAIGIVLCAYMAGLGLGGLLGGRLADRITQRAAVYGVVQAVVAACALAIPPALGWLRLVVPTLPALSPDSLLVSTLARFGLSFAILVVPCFLMGMTLPLLARAVTESDRSIGSRIGVLYCINTLGAAFGCLAVGFWMADTLSLRETNLVAVGVNFLVAIVALVLSRPIARATIPAPAEENQFELTPPKGSEPVVPGSLLLTVAFLNGLAGLACEVLWIRYMAFLISSTYVFPTILCIYLLGMGLGGLVYGLLARWIRRPARVLALVEVLLALSVPATFTASALVFAGGPPPPLEPRDMALVTVFLPTVLMGIAFPLLCAIYGRHVQTLGRRTGVLLAVNTAGTVLGSLLPIFVLVPMLGVQMSLLLVSMLYGVMGLALLACPATTARCFTKTNGAAPNRRLAAQVAIIYAVALFMFFTRVPSNLCQRVFLATYFDLAKHTDILFYREGRTGTAVVTRNRANNCKTVYINAVSEVPLLYPHQLCFKMIGDLAPMLHPNPDEVLMICFGGGVAAGATSCLPEVKHLTIVDLESSVVEAAKLISKENNGLLANPKAHIVIDDGRNYIMTSRRKWPVIVSDSTHPKTGDSWVLYTQEFYRLVHEHLTDDGVFVEWVPTHQLHTAEFKIIVRTFQSVFPHASLWITHGIDEQCRFGSYSLLAGTPGPLKIDVLKLRNRLNAEPVRHDLEPFGLHTPAGFLDTFLCAEEALRRWAGEGPVNTDDLPYTQYETRYSQGALLNNADLIEPMEDIWPYLTNTGSEQEAKQLHEEFILRTKANRLALLGQLENAYAVLPDDIRYRQMRRIYKQVPCYIQTLVGMYRDNPQALQFLAGLRALGPGGIQAAAPIYERVLKLDPKNVFVLGTLAVVRINEGHLQVAEDYLRRAVRLAPDFAEAHDSLGLCLAKRGRVAEAIPCFRRAIDISPTFTDARTHLARAFYQTGRTQEALSHLRYVLKMNPKNETALGLLAKMEGQGETPLEDKSNQELSPGRPRD